MFARRIWAGSRERTRILQGRALPTLPEISSVEVPSGLALELLAAHVAAAEAARRDWEGAHQAAAKNDKYLDLVARTAADQHATTEIAGLAEQARGSTEEAMAMYCLPLIV